jgi:hypothetical protein
MKRKKALFLLNNLPHETTAGGKLYNQIMKSYGHVNISIFGFSSSVKKEEPYKKNTTLFTLDFTVNKFSILKVLKKIPFFEITYILIRYLYLRKKVVRSAVEKIKPEVIFVQLRGNPLFIVNYIIDNFDIPIIGMIEDTVEREKDGGFFPYKIKKKLYYKSLPRMSKIGVAGETLQKYIENNFKIEAHILRPWYEKSFSEKHSYKNSIKIFFGGNLYAKKEFYKFLKALDLFSRDNKSIAINFIIATKNKINYKPDNYEMTELGWVHEKILGKQIKECHISYLPYIFDSKFEHSMTYAFPGKAGYYISNNLPILFHGPIYSSFNFFLKTNKVGVSCSSLELNEIVISISKLIHDKDQYNAFQKNIDRVYTLEYSQDQFDRKVNKIFEI